MSTNSASNKSRNLSVFEYFEQLQREYVVAELRRKIYPSIKDKKYYERVMDQKKQKIKDISTRNRLPSIFDTTLPVVREQIYKEIYNEKGIPNFLYYNEENKAQFEESDIRNYFAESSEVKAIDENCSYIGKIYSVNLRAELVEVQIQPSGKILAFPMREVTRIL